MQLTHTFTVPADQATTWAAFQDISSVAECFPGAAVTSTQEGPDGLEFAGTCKVKLGPVALVYNGTGRFTERDESAGLMMLEAKGKDKRGNGTAGATITVGITDRSADGQAATQVEVVTDLNITGKAAQFGRGDTIQKVSDALLQQFVVCLEQKVTSPPVEASGAADGVVSTGSTSAAGGVVSTGSTSATGGSAGAVSTGSTDAVGAGAAPAASPPPPQHEPEALDLGATVIPILLRAYAKPIAGVAVLVLVLTWLRRRKR